MADYSTKKPITALLVEDSQDEALLFLRMLKDYQHASIQVETAKDLASAISRLDSFIPDCFGMETFRTMRRYARGVPIIILTGFSDETIANGAVHEGAADYLLKGELTGGLLHRAILYAIERNGAMAEAVKVSMELAKRVREIQTLYTVSSMLQDFRAPGPPLMEKIVDMIPRGWQFPEITKVRIQAGGLEFSTPGFRPTPWMQTVEFQSQCADEEPISWQVEVVYLEERPEEFEGPFLKEERSLLNSISDMLRIFCERKRASEALEWEVRVTASVSELARDLLSSQPVEEMSQKVLDLAEKLTESPIGFVGFIDPGTGNLVSPTLTRDVWEKCQVREKSIVFHETKGLFGWVMKEKKPLIANVVHEDARSGGLPEGHVTINRFLSVPAMAAGKLSGVISVANAGRDYNQKDLALLERLALLYAFAVERQQERDLLANADIVIENSPTVLFRCSLSPGFPLEFISNNVSRYGFSQAEMLHGKNHLSLIHEEDIGRVLAELDGNLEKGLDEFLQEFRIKMGGGGCVWAESLVKVIRDDKGKASYLQGVLSNITERKDSERKIMLEAETSNRLLTISEAIARGSSINELLENVVNSVNKITGCRACLSYLWDSASGVFRAYTEAGLERGLLPHFKIDQLDRRDPCLAEAVEKRTSSLCKSCLLEKGIFRKISWVKSVAIIPLTGTTGECLGLIALLYESELAQDFNEREKRLLGGISHQVSMAIERATLHRLTMTKAIELARKVETIQTMSEIDRSILSKLNSKDILETAAVMLTKLIPCDRATLTLVDRERGGLVYEAGFGLEGLEKGHFTPFKDTSCSEVVHSGTTQFTGDLKETGRLKPFERSLVEAGFRSHIRVPMLVKGEVTGVLTLGSKRPSAFTMDDFLTAEKLSYQIAIALENARLVTGLEELFLGTLKTLSDVIDAKSPWTRGHSERVTRLAIELARELGIDQEEIGQIEIAGLLHDIGKIGTYETILDKPGQLTPDEKELIKKHPGKGAEILWPIKQLHHIIPAIRHHHEFYDGQGYPDGLKELEIPLMARILAVADTFDAMCADRPYRKGKPVNEVIDEVKRFSGSQFDPAVVKALLDLQHKQEWTALMKQFNAAA